MRFVKWCLIGAALAFLSGCSNSMLFENAAVEEGRVTNRTKAGEILANLPLPAKNVPVVVYEFQDQTGQYKSNDKITDYSSAVTKGGYSILVKALFDAGEGRWFRVSERGGLGNVLKERRIVKAMSGSTAPELPPLHFAGVIIEGGIVSYDTNIVTGGAGAAYLGISASAQYRRDLVTVYLRAVSVKTGDVILSVTSSKTIYSASLDSNVLKYLTLDNLLQAEAGFTMNEPVQFGVRQAIETAVYSLIMEGALNDLWDFADPVTGKKAIEAYLERRDGSTTQAASPKNSEIVHVTSSLSDKKSSNISPTR